MDQARARALAKDWRLALQKTDAWPWSADRTPQSGNVGSDAIFNALVRIVPETDRACVVERADVPALYALHEQEFYEIECVEISTTLDARARVRKIHLDRAKMPVEATTLVSEASGFRRLTVQWSFGLDRGQPLRMTTEVNTEEDVESDHLFAVALARTLGWAAPPDIEVA